MSTELKGNSIEEIIKHFKPQIKGESTPNSVMGQKVPPAIPPRGITPFSFPLNEPPILNTRKDIVEHHFTELQETLKNLKNYQNH